jgi:2-keto-4-pentenoate hydratase/2-oxohepta-3-ene-1,7-dioic acid hydratase in catechol pathway
MKLVKFEHGGATAEGVLSGDTIHVIGNRYPGPANEAPFTLSRLDVRSLETRLAASSESLPLSSVQLAVPMDPLRKIICAGINYRAHADEIRSEEHKHPVFFTRPLDTLVEPGRPLVRPRASETFDFEGEIAVVLVKGGRHIAQAEALRCVGGYTCMQDGSVRQFQRYCLTAGKNFWRSGSMGPWITTADEIGSSDIGLVTRLNGEVVQSSTASLMIFPIAEIISYLSMIYVLQPGDVIATGTPGGVGSRRTPPLWMKDGDRVEVEVEHVGVLVNAVKNEVA